MAKRYRAVLLLVAMLLVPAQGEARAHVGLGSSDPVAGTRLGGAPTAVRLSFSERPEPSLSEISVRDTRGASYQSGRPQPVAGDQRSLGVPLRKLGRGVYTVRWRVVSAADGHATAGAYAFGIEESPTGVLPRASKPGTAWFELLARWTLLAGLAALLGAASAGAARFGGSAGTELRLGAAAWLVAVVGLVMLTEAQRRNASSSLAALLDTSVGRSSIWCAVATGVAGGALLLARRAVRIRRPALLGAALGALAAMAAHIAGGHAAAGTWPRAVTVLAQLAHFAAAGVWVGGLAALLVGVRGVPSAAKADAVRRFSVVAAAGLIVVLVTGTVRAVDELASWSELASSGYGRAIVAKIALLLSIAGLAARNRRRSVPDAASDLGPLRRTSRIELVLGAGALAVAAVLGTLAPPVAGKPTRVGGISVSGTDLAATVRVRLTAPSVQAGPNRFVVRVEDDEAKVPVAAEQVRLRFTALDDPGTAPTSLALKPGPDGSFVGSGANLAFDGRWRVIVLVDRGRDTAAVPLELTVRGPTQFLSVLRVPGRPPEYTMQGADRGYIRVSPHRERPGRSAVYVTCFDALASEARIERLVLTAAAQDGPTRRQTVRRLGPGRFVADVNLETGPFAIVVVARTSDGSRTRSAFALNIPSG